MARENLNDFLAFLAVARERSFTQPPPAGRMRTSAVRVALWEGRRMIAYGRVLVMVLIAGSLAACAGNPTTLNYQSGAAAIQWSQPDKKVYVAPIDVGVAELDGFPEQAHSRQDWTETGKKYVAVHLRRYLEERHLTPVTSSEAADPAESAVLDFYRVAMLVFPWQAITATAAQRNSGATAQEVQLPPPGVVEVPAVTPREKLQQDIDKISVGAGMLAAKLLDDLTREDKSKSPEQNLAEALQKWKFGPGIMAVHERYGADYGLFLYVHDAYGLSPSTRESIGSSGAVGQFFLKSGTWRTASALLVDLRTGEIVWFRSCLMRDNPHEFPVGDLRTEEGTGEFIDDLLKGLPL